MVMDFKEANKLRIWKFFTRLPIFFSSDLKQAISELPKASVSKRGLVQNHWYKKEYLFSSKMKFIFTGKVLHLASFCKWEFGTRKMAYCSRLAQLSTKKQHLIIDCFVARLYLTIYILLYCKYHTYFLQLCSSDFVNIVKFVHRLHIWMLSSLMRVKHHLYVRNVAIFADRYQTYLLTFFCHFTWWPL